MVRDIQKISPAKLRGVTALAPRSSISTAISEKISGLGPPVEAIAFHLVRKGRQ
jgi:hypothetical protein